MNQEIYIGIDLGGTSIKIGMIDQKGHLVHMIEKITPVNEGYQKVIEVFDYAVKQLLQESGYEWGNVTGVGIGVPGFLDLQKGVVIEAINLGWRQIPLRDKLIEKWRAPVEIDNDANTAALGEMWDGAGKGASHILCITIGTGIGGGVIINGDIYRGVNGMAGEIGHLKVKDHDARACNCGKKGCLETEASATAIVNHALEKVKKISSGPLKEEYDQTGTISARMVVELAKKNDPVCEEIIRYVGHILGKSLAEMCILINPEIIVVGGGISYAGDILFQPLIESFNNNALPRIAENTSIVQAKLGNQAGMIGAAWLVHRKNRESG